MGEGRMVVGIVNVREAKKGADCFTAFPAAEKSMGWRVALIVEIRGRKREDWRANMRSRNGFTLARQITHHGRRHSEPLSCEKKKLSAFFHRDHSFRRIDASLDAMKLRVFVLVSVIRIARLVEMPLRIPAAKTSRYKHFLELPVDPEERKTPSDIRAPDRRTKSG